MFFGLFKKKEKGIEARIDSSSQPFVLKERMERAGMSHDQTVLADIYNIRVREEGGKPVLYFCNINPLVICTAISPGDGEPIPEELKLNKVRIPKSMFKNEMDRYINIRGVKLYSNGTMQVIANSKTQYEMA